MIPDQKRQGEAYCEARGYQLVETFVEPGASATNDRRPEFQRMIEARHVQAAAFDVVVVAFVSPLLPRRTSKWNITSGSWPRNGVKLVSITQEIGDDPIHQMMRRIMALFDEYQSKENAKHVLRALKENARQGFWNGSLPPIGYRVVACRAARGQDEEEAGDRPAARRHRAADLPPSAGRRRHGPARWASRTSSATSQQRAASSPRRRRGGGIGQFTVHPDPPHLYGRARVQPAVPDQELKPLSEIVAVPVPPMIDRETLQTVQALLKARNPKVTPSAVIGNGRACSPA